MLKTIRKRTGGQGIIKNVQNNRTNSGKYNSDNVMGWNWVKVSGLSC